MFGPSRVNLNNVNSQVSLGTSGSIDKLKSKTKGEDALTVINNGADVSDMKLKVMKDGTLVLNNYDSIDNVDVKVLKDALFILNNAGCIETVDVTSKKSADVAVNNFIG